VVNLLVVGGSGFLGLRITRLALLAGHRVIATSHASVPPDVDVDWRRLDVRCADDVTALARQARPHAVINAASRQSDWATTADGGAHVALAAAGAGARLVHVSSDVVFSGAAPSYDETAPPDPVTPYGAAKAAAETAARAIAPDAVIARTSLIIGDGDAAPGGPAPGRAVPEPARPAAGQQQDPGEAGHPAARGPRVPRARTRLTSAGLTRDTVSG
jgi:dTDP-4-dehydrorhamnose reductase